MFQRYLAILVTLIPTLISAFSFLNNLTGWGSTVQYVVIPMMRMEQTFGNPLQVWRAIDSPALAAIAYGTIAALEGVVSLIGAAAIYLMIRARSDNAQKFIKGIRLAKATCVYAFFVWGFFFFVIAGDWFLVWQSADLKPVQVDAVNYSAMVVFTLICLLSLERDIAAAD